MTTDQITELVVAIAIASVLISYWRTILLIILVSATVAALFGGLEIIRLIFQH